MRLLKGGEIINLTDLLDRVFRIEGMTMIVRIVQDRNHYHIVFRTVRISINSITECKDTSIVPECLLVCQLSGESFITVGAHSWFVHLDGLEMAGIPEGFRDVIIAKHLLEVCPTRKGYEIQRVRLITGLKRECS